MIDCLYYRIEVAILSLNVSIRRVSGNTASETGPSDTNKYQMWALVPVDWRRQC